MFEEVPSRLDFPEMEREVLGLWERGNVFGKLREKNRGREPWSFIDGPITANNPMGVHHAWGRTLKDIFQRFKAMQGFDQRHQNGFDCHGLWVEVEVEKELGLNSKREIADYGLDNFVSKCRERVERYSALQTEQSKRLGQWMDWENSYYTMSDANIGHIWSFLKVCHERGWLYRGRRVMPWCARCGTSLSQHEMADSYQDLTHTSVYLRLPLLDRPGDYILVWTTTPWTLPANTALAVHPELEYKKVQADGRILYLSAGTLPRVAPDAEVIGSVKGTDLAGLRYQGPFDGLPSQHGIETRVVAWEDVGEEEGVGVVHIAPGCGEEDFGLAQELDLPVLLPIDENGVYLGDYGWLSGRQVSEVTDELVTDLDRKGLLHATQQYEHRYPVCWRCGEELVFRLVDEWFISCDELREPMVREARKVHWTPEYAGKRMEDWLNNMRDWCISRKRFWGLPLPFYPCECGELTVVGSREELVQLSGSGGVDLPELHRPWIDEVAIACPKCGQPVRRVSEVGDCWMDAGIVPFSTLGYLSDRAYWEEWFPAELVVEMREQIRLWFHAMLFMSVTLTGRSPYRSVLVYEKVNDENGRPMHKSWGNAIWFDDAVEKMGADVMRWLYAGAHPQAPLNFGYGAGKEVVRKLLTLWNVYSFFVTYARVDGWTPALGPIPEPATRPEMDRWLLSRLAGLIKSVTESMESLNTVAFVQAAEAFVDDLSNWYVRLSRRRFWKNEADEGKQSAYATLYETLVTLARLLAPVMPFLSEAMYRNLVVAVDAGAPESVHLCDWPRADESLVDQELMDATEAVMRAVRLGRAARNDAGIKTRQPLAAVVVAPSGPAERFAIERNEQTILDELNVKTLTVGPVPEGYARSEEAGTVVGLDIELTEELVQEGLVRDLVRHIQSFRKEAGLNVEDRIAVEFQAGERLSRAIQMHEDYIRRETLADSLAPGIGEGLRAVKIAGEQVGLRLKKA